MNLFLLQVYVVGINSKGEFFVKLRDALCACELDLKPQCLAVQSKTNVPYFWYSWKLLFTGCHDQYDSASS